MRVTRRESAVTVISTATMSSPFVLDTLRILSSTQVGARSPLSARAASSIASWVPEMWSR